MVLINSNRKLYGSQNESVKEVSEMEEKKMLVNLVMFGGPEFSDFNNAATSLPLLTSGGYNSLMDFFEDE